LRFSERERDSSGAAEDCGVTKEGCGVTERVLSALFELMKALAFIRIVRSGAGIARCGARRVL
jgi:hypothetical protein